VNGRSVARAVALPLGERIEPINKGRRHRCRRPSLGLAKTR
jgi:hypothetical protein